MSVNTVTVKGAPALPRVNLMPAEIAQAARFRRFQLAMGGTVVAAVAVVGLLYSGAQHSVSHAQADADQAQAQVAGLQSQINSLQPLSSAYDQAAAQKAMLAQAMGSEVHWSFYLEDLSLRMPSTVWLTSMNIQQSDVTGATTAATSAPAAAGQIGTISFNGVALSHDDVAKWLTAMAAEKGWTNPYVTNITESTIGTHTVYDWTGTVQVTADALSGRYTQSGS